MIFDLDGTLIDSLPGIASSIGVALRDHPCMVSAEHVRQLIGPPVREVLRAIAGNLPAVDLDRAEAAFRADYDGKGWRKSELFPDGQYVVNRLYEDGFPLYIFTNKPQMAAKRILTELGVHQLFQAILSKDSRTPSYQSKAEMLVDLVTQHRLQKSQSIVIGDSHEDLQAARAMGMQFIFAMYGYGQLSDEDLQGGVGVIHNLNDLLKIL